jgi:LysM repeat protein/uncharacterized protein YvpB
MKKSIAAFFLIAVLALSAHPAAAQSAIPPQAYVSGVVGHAQRYSLSCEARSAADWAAYWGVSIDESEFMDRLPSSDNPDQGFVGDRNDTWGYIPPASYGVHAKPIARLLRDYGLDAHASTGLSWAELQSEIAAGRPAIVWVIGSIWAGTPRDYETEDGQTVRVANNEHTMILIGYTETTVQLVDALTGYNVAYSIDNFLTSWAVLDNMAVTGEGTGQQQVPDKPDSEDAPQDVEGQYTVKSGDTLNKVAARIDASWEDLAAWNDISYPYTIYPGQVLVLSGEETGPDNEPPVASDATYTVQRGDHLLKIARELDLDWTVLADLNELTPPYLLYPGMVLRLPASEDAASAPETPDVPGTYTAARSESLFALAHYYQLDWIRIAGLNNLAFPYTLSPGQTVRLK